MGAAPNRNGDELEEENSLIFLSSPAPPSRQPFRTDLKPTPTGIDHAPGRRDRWRRAMIEWDALAPGRADWHPAEGTLGSRLPVSMLARLASPLALVFLWTSRTRAPRCMGETQLISSHWGRFACPSRALMYIKVAYLLKMYQCMNGSGRRPESMVALCTPTAA